MRRLDSVLASVVLRIRAAAMEDAKRAPAMAARQAKPSAEDVRDCIPQDIDVYIEFTGPDDDIRRLGFTGIIVERPDGKVAAGNMPTPRLWELALLDHVIAAQGPELVYPQTQLQRPESRVGARTEGRICAVASPARTR